MIPDLARLTGPWSLVRGRLSPTLQPLKQVCGSFDLARSFSGPGRTQPPAPRSPLSPLSVCGVGVITQGVLGEPGAPFPSATNAFLKMEPPLAPPSLLGSKSGSRAGWAWLSRRLALAPWVSGSQDPALCLSCFGGPWLTGLACLLV